MQALNAQVNGSIIASSTAETAVGGGCCGHVPCWQVLPGMDGMGPKRGKEQELGGEVAALEELKSLLPTQGGKGAARQGLVPFQVSSSKPGILSSSSSVDSLAPSTPPGEDAVCTQPGLPAAGCDQRCAFVTLLTRDNYLMGVQALARSLQAVKSRHPLLVMYTADNLSHTAVESLQREACQLLAVERYVPAGHDDFSQYKLQLYAECWTKLQLWTLEGFDRLVYLDADMIVLRNIDHLFDLPPGFYAAPDCTSGRQTQAERDACPLFCHERPNYFNAGFFVTTPSRAELARFESLLATGGVKIGGYAEQDLLNEVYKETWQPLPHTYNAQKGIRRHHPELWERHWRDVHIIHYTDAKPWQPGHPEHAQYADLVEIWWRVYKEYRPPSNQTGAGDVQ